MARKREAERYGMAVVDKYRDNAYDIMSKYNLDTRSQWQKDLDQNQQDFSNYIGGGNYTVADNQKYRDMANRAVADLDEQMKRYGKSSNEYKYLDGYKNYYQNALPNFDRMDVTANTRDYLSYDYDNNKFTNWHTQEDYDTQKAYLDQQRQALQTEMDAIEDQTSADYLALKSWQEQYDTLAEALEERNTWDRQFTDINDYTAYEQAGDYKNSIQAKQTLTEAQNRLKDKEAELKTLEMKFAGVDPSMGLTDQQMAEYNQMLQLQNEQKQLQADVLNLTSQVAGIEKWQKSTATQNLYREYGEDADYEQILDDLIAARDKAEEGTEDWAKIDLQIRALAGESENGLNENGQYDDNTLYGRAVMRDFDVEAGQKRLEEIDRELKDLGVSASRFWGGVTNADNNFGVDAAGMVYTDENAVGESDPRVMALRAEKTELTRKLNSAAKFQEKEAAEKAFGGLSEEERNALREAGLQHISQKGDIWYRDSGYDPTQSSGMLENFQYLDDELGGDIRDMLIEAVGAEALGRDIGYTADDILRLYQGDINHIAGKKEADKISAMDSDFARWNRQVLGVGTQAGLNQFVTGMRQAFSDDYIEPNKTAYKAQYTREDLKRYGDEQIANGSNISQMLFDTTQTTANMLPMIAASYLMTKAGLAPVAGEIVGAGLMGLSSGGNTYQQALAEGWDKQDAKAYATILGAAEGTMQYLIGGISGLGGVGEEGLLKAAQGINNAAVRFATETGIHILSETTEELAQNRLQRYLDYKLGATDDADWMSWNDDDWYTVIVTALSTGAMEGLPGGINAVRNTNLGNQLAGNAIPGKATLKSSQARNETIAQIGEAMKGNEALHETLTTIGTNLMEEGSAAYDLAERMESGKAAKSAWNYGVLYSEILSEYQSRNGKDGIEDGMAAVIGGAIKYHEVASAKTAVEEAEAKAAEVRKENPGAEVLSANATALKNLGVNDSKQAQQYSSLVNKVLSGTSLSEAEMNTLLSDSTAAKAARVLLSQQSSNPNALQELNLALTRGNTEAAREAIDSQISEAREVKRQRKEANKAAVAQAAMESADKSEVSRAAQPANRAPTVEMGQDYVRADTRRTIEKADANVEAAQARLDQLKKMSYKDLAAIHKIGAEDTILEAAIDEDMTNEMAALQKRAEELNSVRFPSKEQRTQLADIRDRQAALKARMLDEYQRTAQRAETARTEQQRNEESAAIAAKTNDSVDTIVVGGARMTRDAFVQNHAARLMQNNPNLTQEQANEQALARFNELAAQTPKTEQKTEAKEEHKSKVKPEKREVVRRQKLDGKAHYWTGGTLEGVQYGAVTEAEAEQAIGKTELDFVNNVLSKLVNVTLIKSLPGENGQLIGANGIFYRDGRIYLDINAGTEAHQRSIILAAAHELTHFIRTYNGKAYDKLRDFVEAELKQKGADIETLIKREQNNYKVSTGKELSRDKAVEEVVANACETMLTDANAINRFAAENPTEAKTILDWLTDFFQRIADAFEDLIAVHPEAKAMQDNINSLRDLWLNALVEADANAAKTTLDDHVQTEVNAEGEDVATTSDNGEGVFNLKTWEDGGRTALEVFLKKRVKGKNLDQTQADEMLEQMDKLYDVCEEYDDGTYGPFSAWSNATVIMGKDGKPAFSVVKTNGEYALNLDFSLVCKKRRALDAVFNEMIERGLMNRVIGDEMFLKMYPASIVQINNYIREAGFETACALCFVDTKRYLQAMKADEFCSIYNGLVNSLIEGTDRKAKYFNYGGDMEFFNTWNNRTGIETLPDFELNWSHINEVLRTEKPTSTLYRMADYIKKNPEGRKLAARGDFMSTNGIDAMTIDHARLLELFHAKQGNSNAKDVVSDTPYFNEVIKSSSFTKEKAYSVGGVRIQSFSDYVGRLVFDYIQMVGDLAAKELPAHSYTKEYQLAMQFGKTGIKINMSLVPRVMEDGVAPGLDKDGNYAWMDGQSFGSTVYDNNNKRLTAQQGYELAIQIQNADGYSTNCGTIAVGVSDEHILKMLDDPNIRMIIPYHKSGINHLLAEMNQIGKYKDYTAAQNTRYFVENAKDGVDEITGKHGHWTKLEKGDFNWNDNLQRLEREGKGARECAQLYKDWCAAHGYLPKFNDFAFHPNYYKVLEDFTAYDKDGATPAPLQGVQLNFPVEGDAFGSMQKLIQDGLQEDAVLQAKQDVGVKGIVDRIEAELPAWEAEFREKGDKFAIETSKASMAKTEMRDASFSLRNLDYEITPSTDRWTRDHTTSEVKKMYPGLWDITADESETRNPTQVRDTIKTYRKIYDLLKADGFDGKILDASSGLGDGTRAGREEYGFEVDDIEPFPDKSYNPKYTDYDTLNEKYDAIISNAVLNVLPQDQRDALVVKMGELLNPGGKMYINVRGDDVNGNKSNKPVGGKWEYYVSSTGSYQKGFTKPELKAYLEDALGEGFTVEPTNKFGKTTVIVTKNATASNPTQAMYSSRDTNAPENSNPYPDKTLQHDILEHVRKGDLTQWLNEQKNAYDEALENSKERPPAIPAKGFVPPVTKQQSAAIDNRNRALIQAKGAMLPSEKAANDFRLAKEDEKGNRFHRFFQNVITAEQTQPAWEQAKKFAFTDVAGTYVPNSNKADLKWAKDVIHEDGRESAMKQFNRAAIAMDNSQHNITKNLALGQQLLIETSRDGDMQAFLDVLSSLTLLSSQAGKSLQAFRMLKQSGPIGELYYVEKAVKQLNERNAAKIQAGKMSEITIPEDFANAVLTAATEEEQDKAVDNLIAEIGKQVPVTLMDKWNAWRYLAMLGNARTHIRNLVGNAVFVPLRFAKDLMAAGGEFVLTKTGLMNEQDRRKALFVSKELKDFAKQDALAMQKELQGNGKYNPMREILDARRVLPGFLETLSRKNGQALEYEDWLFLSPAYQNALAQALAHTGYSIEEMLDGSNQDAAKALNRARVLAVEEAQKATYRDFNAAASMLNRIKRMETGKASDKALGILLEGILPFTKTPINILRRGVEYSPIGVASSIFEAAAKVKSGEFDMAEFIDHLSAGLTGSAVVVLGYLLSSLGYLRSKKDDKEEEFEKLQGYQDYSLQIGDVSATIDWAAPTALPLFTGAAIKDLMNGEDLEWKDAWDAMMMIAEPMMSLSMLDGLNNVLSSASYADDSQKLATVASSAFTSYLGQAFPTIAGQLARSMDGTRRATYVDKNSQVPSAIQRFVQSSVQSKMPGWEAKKIPYIDQWGREDTVNSKALGALENFLSPSYINLVHTTDVDETLRELYDATKDSGVLPSTAAKYFSVGGERKDLTADEYVSYAKDVGSTKYQLLTQLFADPRYMRLSDEQKAKAVAKIYSYATATGKYHIDPNYDLHGQGKWMEEADAMPTDIQRFNRIWEYLEEYLSK